MIQEHTMKHNLHAQAVKNNQIHLLQFANTVSLFSPLLPISKNGFLLNVVI